MQSGSTSKLDVRRKLTWFRGHAELVNRIPLMEREAYDHDRAYEHLQTIQSVKPGIRCKLNCMTDGIKVKKTSVFGKRPPRKFYPYKDIHRFYYFADHPEILILGCSDPEKDEKHYEFFKLEANQVEELCQLLERAHSDAMYRLVDYESARNYSSHSSLTGDMEITEDDTDLKKTVTTTDEPSVEDVVNVEEIQVTSTNPALFEPDAEEIQSEFVDTVHSEFAKPNSPLSSVPEHIRDDPLFHSLCANIDKDAIIAVDMQYIEPAATSGYQIANRGAVYLFVAHHRHPDHTHQYDEIEHCNLCHEENTVETTFTTTFIETKTES